MRPTAAAVSATTAGPKRRGQSARREAQGTATQEEGEQAAVRFAGGLISHDGYRSDSDRRHRCQDGGDRHQRSGMGYEQVADGEPFCFLATPVSGQQSERRQSYWEREIANQ